MIKVRTSGRTGYVLTDDQGRRHSKRITDKGRAAAQARTLGRRLRAMSTTVVPQAAIEEIHGLCEWDAACALTDVAEYAKRFREVEMTRDIEIFKQAVDEEFGAGVSDTFLGIMDEVQGILERHDVRPVQDVGWNRMTELTVLCAEELRS